MNSPDIGFRQRTAVSWGLVVLSAAGAVGASALAYRDTAQSISTDSAPTTNGVFDNTWTTPTSTTPAPPGFNGVALAPGSGVHTRSRGS